MTCRQARRHLTVYAAEELSPEPAQAVAEHLATCTRCAGEAAEHATIWRLARQAADLKPAPGFNAAVWERLRNPSPRVLFRLTPLRWPPQRFALAAAFASLMAVSGWLGPRSRSDKAVPPPQSAATRDVTQEFVCAMAAYPAGSVGEAFLKLASTTETSPGGDSPR